MADAKITALTETTQIDGDDVLAIVTDTDTTAVTKKAKVSTLFTIDIAFGQVGGDTPANDETQYWLVSTPFTLPAGATGSQAWADTAATAEAVIDIQKNASSIGDVTYAAAGTTGTFSVASETSFVAGDRLAVVWPSSADATLAGCAITLKCILGDSA